MAVVPVIPWLRARVCGPFYARREGYAYHHHLATLRRELDDLADPGRRERVQVERTAAILRHAYDRSPYYRELYDRHGFRPDRFRDLRDLRDVPTFEKASIPASQDRILCAGFARADLIDSATGGTTGNSFRFWYDRDCYARRHALTLLANERHGWRLGDPAAFVWCAHQDLPSGRPSWRGRVRNWLTARRLYLDATHIDEARLAAWVDALRRHRSQILYGYAHSLRALAEYVAATGASLERVRMVISTAEPLFAPDRALIVRAFGCPVVDRYGSREHGAMAQEDPRGEPGVMGYFAGSLLLECEAAPGEVGDLVVTDFWNRAFPFIRYRIGDAGVLDPAGGLVGGLPRLGRLAGRQTDFLVAVSGARVSGMAFHEAYVDPQTGACGTDDFLAIQFVQTAPRTLRVRYVPGPDFVATETPAKVAALVRRLLGEAMVVDFEPVPEIPRSASGKYRFTVNQMGG